MNYFIRKFIIIKCVKYLVLMCSYFWIIICFFLFTNIEYLCLNSIKSSSGSYFTFNLSGLSIIICFLTSPLVSGIFFSVSSIFFLRPDLLVLYWFFKMNPLESLALNLWLIYHIQIFLTTSISTTLLSFLKPPGTIFSLYQSIWSTSTFELAKSVFFS